MPSHKLLVKCHTLIIGKRAQVIKDTSLRIPSLSMHTTSTALELSSLLRSRNHDFICKPNGEPLRLALHPYSKFIAQGAEYSLLTSLE